MSVNTLNWGILGTGVIARELARGIAEAPSSTLLAVGSRTEASGQAFAQEFTVPRCYATYEALLADPEVQVVYVSTPHPMHAKWAIKAAEAGKHVLVEKPIGMNEAEAKAMIDAASRHGVFLMEAFMYRCHPQTKEISRLIRDGELGEVRLIQATFTFDAKAGPESRLLARSLGGGGILDIGCYTASMSRLIAGAATGKPFEDPLEVKGCGRIGRTGVDEWAIASLKFPGDIVAQLCAGVQLNGGETGSHVRVLGSEAILTIPVPWVPSKRGGDSLLILKKHSEPELRELIVKTPLSLYACEVETVAANLANRQAPEMSWADSMGNIRVLDRWRAEVEGG